MVYRMQSEPVRVAAVRRVDRGERGRPEALFYAASGEGSLGASGGAYPLAQRKPIS